MCSYQLNESKFCTYHQHEELLGDVSQSKQAPVPRSFHLNCDHRFRTFDPMSVFESLDELIFDLESCRTGRVA
jgi:hypothetical protein